MWNKFLYICSIAVCTLHCQKYCLCLGHSGGFSCEQAIIIISQQWCDHIDTTSQRALRRNRHWSEQTTKDTSTSLRTRVGSTAQDRDTSCPRGRLEVGWSGESLCL